jgi:hypothetical protein
MRLTVSSKHSIYAAIVSIDIASAVTYRSEDFPSLNDTHSLSPLPSEFFSLRAFQRASRGYLAYPLTKIQVTRHVIGEVTIIVNNLIFQWELEETKGNEFVNVKLTAFTFTTQSNALISSVIRTRSQYAIILCVMHSALIAD